MLGVVGLDLLPEALEAAGTEVLGVPAALLLFVAGFLLAHLVERLLAHRQAAHGAEERGAVAHSAEERGAVERGAVKLGVGERAFPAPPAPPPGRDSHSLRDGRTPEVGLTAAAAMVGHSAMDGVAIGAAFQVGGGMGAAVALAVVAHDFADGFNTYTITSAYGNGRRRALAMLCADAVAPVLGAASTVFVTIPEPLLGAYLGFFGGALLYLAAAEILPEAHHTHPARSTLLCTVAGVAFIWLVVGLAG
ncbi:ZIP family metal transporter [Streptomyces sp. NPDC003247]|uniref:ZIP family metal transporter n=1 Tax=Streptomyces sp. NPDC003247 TaxID=3364677 RepID=UPI0036A1DE89